MYSIQEKAAFFFPEKHFLELLWGFCPQFKAQWRSLTFCKSVLITVGGSLTEKKGPEQDISLHILLLSFYNNITMGWTQPLLTLRNEYFQFKDKGQYQDASKDFPSLISHSFVQQEQTFLALPAPKHPSKDLATTNTIGGMLEVVSLCQAIACLLICCEGALEILSYTVRRNSSRGYAYREVDFKQWMKPLPCVTLCLALLLHKSVDIFVNPFLSWVILWMKLIQWLWLVNRCFGSFQWVWAYLSAPAY